MFVFFKLARLACCDCFRVLCGAFDASPPLNRPAGKIYASLPRGGIPGSGIQSNQLVEVLVPHYGLNDAPQRW